MGSLGVPVTAVTPLILLITPYNSCSHSLIMLPPKYARSVQVTAHETHLFSEMSEDMGTWTAVRKITHIKVERDGVVAERVVGDDCEGVHGCLHYKLAADHSLAIHERK